MISTAPARQSLAREQSCHPNMVLIPAGTFRMESDRDYPGEAPVHRVTVAPFRIYRPPVTKSQFLRFVEAIGPVTVAEFPPGPKHDLGALPHRLNPSSLVFTPPRSPADLQDWTQSWSASACSPSLPCRVASNSRGGQPAATMKTS
jgi:formylglycine-generating enzyme